MKITSLFLLLFLAISSSTTAQDADAKAIVGTWRGTSLCVNLDASPGCKNEEVIYEFRELTPPVAGKLNLNADRIVDGKAVPMGELDFVWVPAEGAWSCEIQTPRVHALWSFKQLRGDELAGTLVQLPSRTLVRKASARRQPKS